MKATRRIIAVLLTVLLMMPNTSALALEDPMAGEKLQTEENSSIAESTEEAFKTEGTSSTAQSTEENSKTEENSSIAEKTEDPSKTEGASSTAESTEEFSKTEETSSTAEKTEESSKTEETSSTTESTEETFKTEENPSTAQSTEESSKTEETSGTAESTNVEETFETGDTLEEETETATEMETEIEIETLEEKILNKENLSALMEDAVQFNTGNYLWSVISAKAAGEGELPITDSCVFFAEDGSYTIDIPEENPFFPYEVQFTYHGEVTTEWFMTPQSSVEVGGHTFYVSPRFDGTAVTQMSLNVGGDTIVVYPERKEFTNDGTALYSLQPLEEVKLEEIDLTGYTPAELTMVNFDQIFTGNSALKNTDQIIWKYKGTIGKGDNTSPEDDYRIISSGEKIDLSHNTYDGETNYWEMIVGTADQLDTSNIRYFIPIKVTKSRKWLVTTAYKQDNEGKRNQVSVIEDDSYYHDYGMYSRYLQNYVLSDDVDGNEDIYISIKINDSMFTRSGYSSIKVYEGRYETADAAMSGTDITNQICCTDMTVADAGYKFSINNNKWVTLIVYNDKGNVTGCLPFYIITLRRTKSNSSNSNSISSNIYLKTENSQKDIARFPSNVYDNGVAKLTYTLFREYPADGVYNLSFNYYKSGQGYVPGAVTAAYVGQFSSIAEANTAKAENIKETLFDYDKGYDADFSKGVYFSIFVGNDGDSEQEIYKYWIKTETGDESAYSYELGKGTAVTFKGIKDAQGKDVTAYVVGYDEDSYADFNYRVILVAPGTDRTSLAPVFETSKGVRLYTPGTKELEESGKTLHDFSKGPVQYSAGAENKEELQNYWLEVVEAANGVGKLSINSLNDPEAKTRVDENGVIYSNREVVLDSIHEYIHDILFTNMGTEPIIKLSAELDSDVLELDEYWTLKGTNALSGFRGTETTTEYGELSNLAKVRIRAKDGVSSAEVSGTLTIKSDNTTLMVLTLTGVVGNPQITTKGIPQAVKYVPYGTMIQNNNKYSWNKVSYSLESGSLPGGMEIRKNGELYGVPTEAGEFKFTVRMKNSYNNFSDSKAALTLEVIENTDTNVNNATDQGYDVLQRIQDVTSGTTAGDRLFISQGLFTDFEHHVYLDGRELEENVEYSAESGSTRITIKSETLDDLGKGKHTLGVEFRDDEESLKRAAQNFNVKKKGSNNSNNNSQNDNNNSSNDNSNSSHTNDDDDDGDSNSNSVSPAVSNTANKNTNIPSAADSNININTNASVSANAAAPETAETVTTVSYTVETGDTLWKIAEKFYGSGTYWNKVYEDNAATISSPDRIFAGQTIIIYITQTTAFTQPSEVNPVETDNTAVPVPEVEAVISEDGITKYIVQPGDTLWKIAKEFYGRGWEWRRIYEANGNVIPDPASLSTGRVLVIPTR